MRKSILILLLLLTAATVFGQKKSIVILVKSQSANGIKVNGKDVEKVYQGTFKQDYSTLTSDSAYFYPQDNAVDAFGHVVIDQGDTLHIYSDKLNYNGNTKVAILTDNVRMVDKDATLTTNHLNYNTATRIATYTDGGKLVNKDNTLVSKNGYYFAYTRDSYFRYTVSLKTPDALVVTDTMRYNTGTKISYFYGPTNIYSTKNEKDRDTLYTENGDYNTNSEQARFGKHNLYHSGTKSLKGDSLFYDKAKGYGRAVKHVTFEDKEQKVTIKGDLGTYFKEEEHTIVTQDPYIIMVSERKDTTNTDSAAKADSIAKADLLRKRQPANTKAVINMSQLIKKTIPADTAAAKKITAKVDSALKSPQNKAAVTKTLSQVKKSTDSLKRKTEVKPPGGKDTVKTSLKAPKDTSKVKTDSIYMSADTIETRILTYKNLKKYLEEQRLAHVTDSTGKPKKPKADSKLLTAYRLGVRPDTVFRNPYIFGKPPVKTKKPPTKKQLERDSLIKKHFADSVLTAKLAEPNDTARIRIILAHHNFKMFKSDLQAKADSMFYSGVDSTIRCFNKPMMWAEGSQLSGDTIYLQMKHKKMDNMRMFPNAFIVNIEKTDSVHFNQVAGKRMRGYFKDDKLQRMFVEGNAESIYFVRDSGKMTISGMQRSLSSRIRVDFKNNQVTNLGFYTKPENKYSPMNKLKDDDKILKGFIWKPKDRPVSKESIIPSYNKKKEPATKGPPEKSKTDKGTGKKPANGKPPAKGGAAKPAPTGITQPKTAKDSTNKTDTTKTPVIKPMKDTTVAKQNL